MLQHNSTKRYALHPSPKKRPYLLFKPLISRSFVEKKKNTAHHKTKTAAAIQTLYFAISPFLFHISLYHRMIFSNFYHFTNLLMLLVLPTFLLQFLIKRNVLWWTDWSEAKQKKFQNGSFFVCFFVLIWCFEYRGKDTFFCKFFFGDYFFFGF